MPNNRQQQQKSRKHTEGHNGSSSAKVQQKQNFDTFLRPSPFCQTKKKHSSASVSWKSWSTCCQQPRPMNIHQTHYHTSEVKQQIEKRERDTHINCPPTTFVECKRTCLVYFLTFSILKKCMFKHPADNFHRTDSSHNNIIIIPFRKYFFLLNKHISILVCTNERIVLVHGHWPSETRVIRSQRSNNISGKKSNATKLWHKMSTLAPLFLWWEMVK